MKAVLQRVTSASVTVDSKIVSSIGRGFCVLIGIATCDTEDDMDYIIKKLLTLKLFPAVTETSTKQWAKNIQDIQGEILCVSQFTLHATTQKGTKPDFHRAMPPPTSKEFYDRFLMKIRQQYSSGTNAEEERIKDGVFGAMMSVNIVNDGPVTIVVDSRNK
ncbi:D-tyrosyl-tRNA deacylase 1 [Paraphysoderma sedebokerense]|nr:D-tyrosyl-tRNA deacylase 1 [Paraphysoderma sedebokerense]